MDKNLFLNYLLEPEKSGMNQAELIDLTGEYPWFTTARILRLLALKSDPALSLQKEIVKAVPFIHNRKQLYRLMHSELAAEMLNNFTDRLQRVRNLAGKSEFPDLSDKEQRMVMAGKPGGPPGAGADTIELLEFTYSGQKKTEPLKVQTDEEEELLNREFETLPEPGRPESETPKAEKQNVVSNPGKARGFTNWIEKLDTNDTGKEENTTDLIEIFINGGHGPIRADKETSITGDISKRSIEEDESYITDTLAKIYVKQGLYSKAIYAYEKLSLKYPEKSVYFATQIEEIKRLIHK